MAGLRELGSLTWTGPCSGSDHEWLDRPMSGTGPQWLDRPLVGDKPSAALLLRIKDDPPPPHSLFTSQGELPPVSRVLL